MSKEMTNSEAIANLNHIYGIVSPDIQRSLDVAFKALETPTIYEFKGCDNCELERPKGEWENHGIINICSICNCDVLLTITDKICNGVVNFCPNCGADMREADDDIQR